MSEIKTVLLNGVRQGCILSPLLFNINAVAIFAEALNATQNGVKVAKKYKRCGLYNSDC